MPIERTPEKLYIGHQAKSIKEDCLDGSTLGAILSTATRRHLDFIVLPIESIDQQHEKSVQQEQQPQLWSPYPAGSAALSASPTAVKPINPESNNSNNSSSDSSTRQWIHHKAEKGSYSLTPLVESDLALPSASWSNSVVLSMSRWIQIDDDVPESTTSKMIQSYCQDAFQQQLVWASHCGAYATILPTPTVNSETMDIQCARYASLLSRFCSGYLSTQLWIRIPVVIETCDGTYIDGWRVWNTLRDSVGLYNIGVALVIGDTVPDNVDLLERWIAEPVRAVIIPGHLFVVASNKSVALPKMMKNLVMKLMRQKAQIIIQHGELSENPSIEESIQEQSSPPLSSLVDYVGRMFLNLPSFTEAEAFEFPYLDYLQSPLQPLRDNLESQTYETFEKDPVKYAQYEEAIYVCLLDRIAAGKTQHVVMVVGAGRGPLVASALNALRRAKVAKANYRMIAIEKNMNAVITLRSRVKRDADSDWRHVVVVWSDMRSYKPSEKVDIMISELLGSFGDNELSPECLDGAQTFLADDGVMIPTRYFSSIEPISTPKLWSDCKQRRDGEKALETSYVVQFHAVYRLSSEGPLKCFEFIHPSPERILSDNSHNNRYQQLTFTAKADSICHGFAGYFHCDLYKDIQISTHPPTYSEGMFSWFPLYFPLKQPIYVPEGRTLKCHFWRLSNQSQIWYEWSVSQPKPSTIHNVNGGSHAILK